MRRSEREIKDRAEIDAVINRAAVCRIGFCDGNIPYVVPVNYGYQDNCLYFHCAKEGRKLDMMAGNNHVCFEMDEGFEPVKGDRACKWSARYCSVIGFGKALLVEDYEEKVKGLNAVMEHYSGVPAHQYAENEVNRVAVVKIEIESITGKKSGY